ncbi:MAG: hypothetical protein ABI852_01510 [Gemmatimonadaceae bacterium]
MTAHDHERPAAKAGTGFSNHEAYWKRAHTDWRFWVGVVLMLGAMAVYVMSENLAWAPHAAQPGAVSR